MRVGNLVLLLVLAAGCVQTESAESEGAAPGAHPRRTDVARRASAKAAASDAEPGHDAAPAATGAQKTAPLVVMTWNLDWFSDPNEGPSDDAAQYAAVRDILRDAPADVIGLQEVASSAAFERLLSELPGRAAVLSGYDWTQKTALLWDDARFELVSEYALSGLDDAGRPPLEVTLRRKASGAALVVLVIHAKAQADAASHATRARLAQGLKQHLDRQHAPAPLIVLGDFNDSLIGSITSGADSPYRVFLDDPRYAAPTRVLDAADAVESSYAWGATIDHILISAELAGGDPSEADVLRDELLADYPDYLERVSDHFPVNARLWW